MSKPFYTANITVTPGENLSLSEEKIFGFNTITLEAGAVIEIKANCKIETNILTFNNGSKIVVYGLNGSNGVDATFEAPATNGTDGQLYSFSLTAQEIKGLGTIELKAGNGGNGGNGRESVTHLEPAVDGGNGGNGGNGTVEIFYGIFNSIERIINKGIGGNGGLGGVGALPGNNGNDSNNLQVNYRPINSDVGPDL